MVSERFIKVVDSNKAPVRRQISPEEMIKDVRRIRDFFRTAQFQKSVSLLQAKLVTDEAILSEDAIQLFN